MPAASTAGPAIASDFDLAFFFVLDRFTSLEPFGTDPRYIRFLQGKAARLLKAFAGADVALTGPFPAFAPFAVCLALAAPEETYDWEVRSALESWAAAPPNLPGPGALDAVAPSASAVGLAIGERQRYRGCVLGFTTMENQPAAPLADRRFEASLIAGRTRRL